MFGLINVFLHILISGDQTALHNIMSLARSIRWSSLVFLAMNFQKNRPRVTKLGMYIHLDKALDELGHRDQNLFQRAVAAWTCYRVYLYMHSTFMQQCLLLELCLLKSLYVYHKRKEHEFGSNYNEYT